MSALKRKVHTAKLSLENPRKSLRSAPGAQCIDLGCPWDALSAPAPVANCSLLGPLAELQMELLASSVGTTLCAHVSILAKGKQLDPLTGGQ